MTPPPLPGAPGPPSALESAVAGSLVVASVPHAIIDATPRHSVIAKTLARMRTNGNHASRHVTTVTRHGLGAAATCACRTPRIRGARRVVLEEATRRLVEGPHVGGGCTCGRAPSAYVRAPPRGAPPSPAGRRRERRGPASAAGAAVQPRVRRPPVRVGSHGSTNVGTARTCCALVGERSRRDRAVTAGCCLSPCAHGQY